VWGIIFGGAFPFKTLGLGKLCFPPLSAENLLKFSPQQCWACADLGADPVTRERRPTIYWGFGGFSNGASPPKKGFKSLLFGFKKAALLEGKLEFKEWGSKGWKNLALFCLMEG